MSTLRLFALPSLLTVVGILASLYDTRTAHAGLIGGDGGRTAIWVYIRKSPDEGIWEACRRVYRRDVYQVRGAGPRKARCLVDASEANHPRGFNTSRELD
jgi:hypothetical protein